MPTINIEGANLYYQVHGEGIPIVFIHPPLLTSTNFKYQVEQLSQEFQTIVFDIRGHGNSSLSEEPVTYSQIALDISDLLEHLKIGQAYLCGYSTGGGIALEFLLKYPDKAIGAILLGPMPAVIDWRLKQEIKLAVSFSKHRLLSLLRLAICFSNSDNKNTFQELYQEAKKGNAENIKQYYQSSLNYDCTSSLSKITKPILLLYGKKNKQFHRYAQILKNQLPNNQLHYIENMKHQLPTKAASETNQLIKAFINQNQD